MHPNPAVRTAAGAFDEAQNRIKSFDGDSLDLAISTLKRLPEELGSLSGLKKLDLSWTRVTDFSTIERLPHLESLSLNYVKLPSFGFLKKLPGLRELSLNGASIRTLNDLTELTRLRVLDLSCTTKLKTLTPIMRLTQLEELHLFARGLTDILALEPLVSLRVLNLGGAGIENLSPLRNMVHLEALDLNDFGGSLTDLAPIAGLSKLKVLNLSGHQGLCDIAPLRTLTKLEDLDLSNCPVSDCSPLTALKRISALKFLAAPGAHLSSLQLGTLQRLDLAVNEPVDLSFLEHSVKLRTLKLARSDSADFDDLPKLNLAVVGRLTDLEELAVSLPLDDISFISSCRRLKSVFLYGAGIANLDAFRGVDELESLDLMNCPNLRDLSGLSALPKLAKLGLTRCREVADVTPISKIASLAELSIVDASVNDASALGQLPALEQLTLQHCRMITRLGSFQKARRLRRLEIEGGNFSNIDGLAGLPELEHLVLASCKNVTDISVVATLPKIESLILNDSTNIKHIRPLEGIVGQLSYLELDGCEFNDAPDLLIGFEEDMTCTVRAWFLTAAQPPRSV